MNSSALLSKAFLVIMGCSIRGKVKGRAEAWVQIRTRRKSHRRTRMMLVKAEMSKCGETVQAGGPSIRRLEARSAQTGVTRLVPPLSGVASRRWRRRSHLLGAVGAVDVVRFDDEALVGQRQRALLTVEAVLVPGVALVVHHVGAVAEPCGGAGR